MSKIELDKKEFDKMKDNIFKAVIAFQKECPNVTFDASVKYKAVNFKYASLPHIFKTIRPILAKHGLGVIQDVSEDGVRTTIIHESGERIEGERTPIIIGNKMQELGSAITYAKRYSLSAILAIATEEDDDGSRDAGRQEMNPDHPKWNDAVKAVSEGKATVNQIRKKYNLSEENKALLVEELTQTT